MEDRRYLKTHPWITFQYGPHLNQLWAKLGEAYSKCQHLAGIPIKPAIAQDLASFVLTKGSLATVAIEGNTLTEREAQQILNEGKQLPPSQDYLEQEIRNVARALDTIDNEGRGSPGFELSAAWLKEQNIKVLDGLEVASGVVPGEYTTQSLVVGSYRAAPPEDVPYLVDRLCDWLNESFIKPSQDPNLSEDVRFYHAFFGAVIGHLYSVWIHPFGDGNGRTARLLEVAILAHSGVVPWVASNLLSDHYNRTRTRYYQKLAAASQKNDIDGLVQYAAEGLVDMLREQIDRVRSHQVLIAWESFVHERFHGEPAGKAKERRLKMVLTMETGKRYTQADIRHLNIELAELYAGHETRIITRDLRALEALGLVRMHENKTWSSNAEIMSAFMPIPQKL